MANIDKELNQIKNAIYGKEVRGSIHDGIDKINKETEHATDKSQEAIDVTNNIIDESFDHSVIESNFEQRLDNEINNLQPEWTRFKDETTQQLAETASKTYADFINEKTNLNSHVRYGYLWFPEEFTKELPFKLLRDRSGVIRHDFKIDSLKIGKGLYVNENIGDDTSGDGSEESPYRSLHKAIREANVGTDDNYVIYVTSHLLSRNYAASAAEVKKNIQIRPKNAENEIVIANSEYRTAFSWVKDGNAYKAKRSGVMNVNDLGERDIYNLPAEYKKVDSVAEVKAERSTWYTDGVDVWVRRFDDTKPNGDVLLLLASSRIDWTLENSDLSFVNCVFLKVSAPQQSINGFRVTGTGNSRLFLFDTVVKYGTSNGIALVNVKESYLFNCATHSNGKDGFNYHGDGSEFVFEYNCESFNNGTLEGNGTYNATTAHDGMTILRIGSVGYDCYGPLLADVNGCLSLNFDCQMSDSLKNAGPTKAAYWFDKTGSSPGVGKAYLINCGGGGIDTWSINTDGQADVYIQKFEGNQFPEDLKLNFL